MWTWFVVYFVLTAEGRLTGPHYLEYGNQAITCQLYGPQVAHHRHNAYVARCLAHVVV
jgi:hypothetical protein